MANHIFVLASVMLLTGIFGGLINFYLYSQYDPDTTSLPRCIVIAIGAAFLVPVLLDIVNSGLIVESQGDPSKLLIFSGYCLISAVLSKFVVSNISDRILLEAHSAKERSEELQHDLKLIQSELLPLIDTETEQSNKSEMDIDAEDPSNELDVASSNVLKTLGSGRYIFRSVEGLCREANSDENTVSKTLNVLVAKSLAGKVSGKKGMRWYITERGRRVLDLV